MRRSLGVLSVVLTCACSSPSAQLGAAIDGGASPVGVTVSPESSRAAGYLAAIEQAGAPLGAGAIEVEDLDGAPQWLELAALHVDVRTAGAMARYEVEHVFVNPSERVLEGTFRFPLPSGSIVTGLAMEIDGKLMDGEMLERERARQIYQDIVDSMRDPALLEWEAGQQFKLRVFPINPGERKRVVMRYMAPLRVDEQAARPAREGSGSGRATDDMSSGFAVEVPSAVPAMQTHIPALTVALDGEVVARRENHDARDNLTVPLSVAHVPAYIEERHDGRRYLAARVELDWGQVGAPTSVPTKRRTIIVVDSSRSALESWPLAREAVATLLDALPAGSPFSLLTADIGVRGCFEGFVANDAATRGEALACLDGIEPDGASDLGRALDRVGELLASGEDSQVFDQVVYVGDGTPTWGATEREQLHARAEAALSGATLYALSLGKHESRDILEALTGPSGGRTVAPRSAAQVAAFASFVEHAPQARRLADVRVEIPGVTQLHGPSSATLFEGERPVINFALDEDMPAPHELIVHGYVDGREFEQVVALGQPETSYGARQQFVARELTTLTDKPAIVELSVAHSVLSKHTALLVLESEEAYERYDIERRSRAQGDGPQAEGDPTISGRNLDGDADPYLGPGDLQPGDPEIHIPAPRDAVSVEVVFPFGETKAARWEHGLGQWTVRFLVDDDTAPGTYAVLVRVTHADGRVELLELEYTIDVEAPQLRLELRTRDDGGYDVFAHQVLSERDAARERVEGVRGEEQAATLDAKRVELLMPDGQTLTLRAGLPGSFVRKWVPQRDVEFPATVTAVVADRALNSRRVELVLPSPDVEVGR